MLILPNHATSRSIHKYGHKHTCTQLKIMAKYGRQLITVNCVTAQSFKFFLFALENAELWNSNFLSTETRTNRRYCEFFSRISCEQHDSNNNKNNRSHRLYGSGTKQNSKEKYVRTCKATPVAEQTTVCGEHLHTNTEPYWRTIIYYVSTIKDCVNAAHAPLFHLNVLKIMTVGFQAAACCVQRRFRLSEEKMCVANEIFVQRLFLKTVPSAGMHGKNLCF